MWSLDNNVVILLHNIICIIWFIETRYQQERDRYWVEKKSARCKILSILNKHHYQSYMYSTKNKHKDHTQKRPFDIESGGMKGEVAQPRYNCLNWGCPDYIQYPHVLISRLLRYTEQARDHILQYSVTMTYKNSTCTSSGLAVYNIYIISS